MWTAEIARHINSLKPYVPKGLKYIFSEEENGAFIKLTIDPESIFSLNHDDKIAAVVWMDTVKKVIEG